MSENILEIKDLNIQYEMEFYRTDSVRDMFVGMVNRPLQTLFGRQDVIHNCEKFQPLSQKGRAAWYYWCQWCGENIPLSGHCWNAHALIGGYFNQR